MPVEDERIRYAVSQTEILRLPRQSLATFGTTIINYYLLTEPAYSELVHEEETVIREGKVSSDKPRVITPYYLSRLEGFGENAGRYLDMIISQYGPHAPGVLYRYKNEPKEFTIVSDRLEVVAERLNERIDKKGDRLTAIVKGIDELWDVSLLRFISELTERSLRGNLVDLDRRGLLGVDQSGLPAEARQGIENLFLEVARGERDPSVLKEELDRWDIFPEYEDRFLDLFRKK
jgi:hypothetical protein